MKKPDLDSAFNDGYKLKQPFWPYVLLVLLLLVLAARCADAKAEPNLPLVCPKALAAGADGQLVKDACGGYNQTGQVYRWPTVGDLVRVNPTQLDWADPGYKWKGWAKLTVGEAYQVCGDNVPSGTPVTGDALCTNWPWIKYSAAVTQATLTWSPPTENTDGSALAGPLSFRVYLDGKSQWTTTATKFIVGGLPAGLHCFYVTATASGVESSPSGTGCIAFKVAAPSNGKIEAPSNGTIQLK